MRAQGSAVPLPSARLPPRRRPADPPVQLERLRVSAGGSTGVAPLDTTCFGPRTAAARFTGSKLGEEWRVLETPRSRKLRGEQDPARGRNVQVGAVE